MRAGHSSFAKMLHEVFDLLWAIRAGKNPMTARELSLVCEHTIATTYREIGRAEDLGWIVKGPPRRAPGMDRVAGTWHLTPSGDVMLEAWSKAHEYFRLAVIGDAPHG